MSTEPKSELQAKIERYCTQASDTRQALVQLNRWLKPIPSDADPVWVGPFAYEDEQFELACGDLDFSGWQVFYCKSIPKGHAVPVVHLSPEKQVAVLAHLPELLAKLEEKFDVAFKALDDAVNVLLDSRARRLQGG
jgi:hypothetical protein